MKASAVAPSAYSQLLALEQDRVNCAELFPYHVVVIGS
jgi:hypothetical protein